jgi:hypothetical protein
MRLKAAKEAGMQTLPVILADDWTEEQKAEFLIKDNVGFGEWDWEQLANEWDSEKLDEWGLVVPITYNTDDIDLDNFFEENNNPKEQKNKIVLEYTDEEFELVNDAFKKHAGSKEQIIFKLLGL